jgi:hypothetical protein
VRTERGAGAWSISALGGISQNNPAWKSSKAFIRVRLWCSSRTVRTRDRLLDGIGSELGRVKLLQDRGFGVHLVLPLTSYAGAVRVGLDPSGRPQQRPMDPRGGARTHGLTTHRPNGLTRKGFKKKKANPRHPTASLHLMIHRAWETTVLQPTTEVPRRPESPRARRPRPAAPRRSSRPPR